MQKIANPTVMLLDGEHGTVSLQVAAELSQDLRATIIGIGSSMTSPLLRSRYCHVKDVALSKNHPEYPHSILQLIHKHQPDMVLPTGDSRSVAALDSVRARLPEEVAVCLPPSRSLETTLDKSKTLAVAKKIGVPVPEDYTELVRDIDLLGRDPDRLEQLPFPLFLKVGRESHNHYTSKIESPAAFWPAFDQIREWSEEGGDGSVLVQEYVDGGHNYCYGLLLFEDDLALSFGHEKVLSVPRRLGSATRVRVFQDRWLETISIKLLRELDWTGVALVEYKRRADGTYALMEINGRFWGAYPLASKCDFRFASTLVARSLGLPIKDPPEQPDLGSEMVFPIRELKFWLQHKKQRSYKSFFESVFAMGWPPCRWNVNVEDVRAALPPGGPLELAKKVKNHL